MTASDKQPSPDAIEQDAPTGDPSSTNGGASGSTDGDASASSDADLRRQLEDQREKHLRLAAEFDNARRRWTKEREETRARAQGDLVRHLIDALDDIGRFAHVDPATTDASTVVKGVEMVEKKLMKLLAGAGLEVIDPAGQQFDPALHEAVSTEPTPAREDDHVVARVYQVGYRFGNQLLRPARVVVKQHG